MTRLLIITHLEFDIVTFARASHLPTICYHDFQIWSRVHKVIEAFSQLLVNEVMSTS